MCAVASAVWDTVYGFRGFSYDVVPGKILIAFFGSAHSLH